MLRACLIFAVLWPVQLVAQDTAIDPSELAELRSEIAALSSQMEVLSAMGSMPVPAGQVPPLDASAIVALGALEREVARLTGKVEALSFRIDRVAADGANRIGDLEFRLTELEGGDVTAMTESQPLGGAAIDAAPAPDMAMAIGEEADFERAESAYADGDLELAAGLYAQFLATYPGGPMSVQAAFQRGEALSGLQQHKEAARAYLDTFTADPNGTLAPRALMNVGLALGALGQRDQACSTLNEVAKRYPNDVTLDELQANRLTLGCN